MTVTPEQAREMLDRVKEGCPLPWEIFALETIEEDPREVKNVRCSEPGCDGHLAYSMDYDGTTEIDPDAIELVAAAPALAELVANLRYEYAVVCLVEGDVWRYARGGVLITPLEHEAKWFPSREEAEGYAERRRSTAKETRVVPRLVSEPEVAE